jgi:hemoglobin
MTKDVPTLYEWIGGAPALEKLTVAFYAKVKVDPLIAPIFAHMDAKHPHYVAQFRRGFRRPGRLFP